MLIIDRTKEHGNEHDTDRTILLRCRKGKGIPRAKADRKKKRQSNAEKPISLKPLQFDEAVSDLLKVKPGVKKTKPAGDNRDLEA